MNTTRWIWLLLGIGIAAGDYVAYVVAGTPHTISGTLHEWAGSWPLLPAVVTFALGMLVGHVFPVCKTPKQKS